MRNIVNSDSGLTEKGHEQAVLLAQYIVTKSPDYIVSSHRVKTLQVAAHISEITGLGVNISENFRERDWGDWAGYTREEVEPILSEMDIEERYVFTPPNGESWENMERRLLRELDNIAQLGKECVVVVTHKSCLRSLMRVLLKGELDNHEQFSVGMASCTIVLYENGEYGLETRNELSHLGDKRVYT